ncbi:MAG: hypothetical protein ACRDPY_16300 [Streptosporangiaceae bacterium]
MLSDILSITAIVISSAALGWQVLTWRRSGAVVSVTATQAIPTFGDNLGDPHVNVTASNKGRSPVTITSLGFKLRDDRHLAVMKWTPWSASLPHRLEPGAAASWYVPTNAITESTAHNGIRYQDLIAYVSLGDGRTIKAPKRGIGWA